MAEPVDRTIETKDDVFYELLSDYAGVSIMREQLSEAEGLNTIRNKQIANSKTESFKKRFEAAT